MACQICFEDDVTIAGNNDIGGALCRRSCVAQVCVSCLTRHVEVSLAGFYAGVLPLIRCPICLLPMRFDRWMKPLGLMSESVEKISELRQQYEALSSKACMLTPPCCHTSNYTHLPDKDLAFKMMRKPLALLPSKVVVFRKLVARFCGHRVDACDVVTFATDHFGDDNARELVERTLRHIADSERRARLLLAYVHLFPKIETLCCQFAMCFNCKRIGHHDKCEEFEHAVDEAECLVRCRKCRVMLMKVQGCDAVDCVCGFAMSWSEEVKLRRLAKKQMLPIDLFDKKAVDAWQQARGVSYNMFYELERKHEEIRQQRLDAWILKHRDVFFRSVEYWVWRYRWTKPMLELARHHEQVFQGRVATWSQRHKDLVFRSVERWAWRIRFCQSLVQIRRELFWEAYHVDHPEERAEVMEDEAAFFMIDV